MRNAKWFCVLLLIGPFSAIADDAVIELGPGGFSPSYHMLGVGSSVTWVEKAGKRHELADGNGLLRNSVLEPGGELRVSFPASLKGDYDYRCLTHGKSASIGLVGSATQDLDTEAAPSSDEPSPGILETLKDMIASLFGIEEPEEELPVELLPDPEGIAARTRVAELKALRPSLSGRAALLLEVEINIASERAKFFETQNRLASNIAALQERLSEIEGVPGADVDLRRESLEAGLATYERNYSRRKNRDARKRSDPNLAEIYLEHEALIRTLLDEVDPEAQYSLLLDLELNRQRLEDELEEFAIEEKLRRQDGS